MRDRGTVLAPLIGVAAAGALVWVATRLNGGATWRYWAVLGVLAGGGIALSVALRSSSGEIGLGSPLGFVLALVPATICVVWIAIAGEPHSNWFRDHITRWSSDIGIGDLVTAMTRFTPALALGLGVVAGSMPMLVARRAPVATAADGEPTAVVPARAPTVDEPTVERPGRRVPIGG